MNTNTNTNANTHIDTNSHVNTNSNRAGAGQAGTQQADASSTSTTAADRPAALGTILSIWAHPDDETYLAAGTMAAARDAGQRVVCVSATAGEHGTADPHAWPPVRLARVRRWEAAASMAILGVHEHHVAALPDGGLDDHESAGMAWAAAWLDDTQPDTILTFGPDGMTYHPDHIAVHRWVTAAWLARGCRERLLYAAPTVEHLERFRDLYEQWNMYMSDQRPIGVREEQLALHLRLSGAALDRKLAALRAIATQTAGIIAMLDPEVYSAQVGEEAYVDARRLVRRTARPAAAAGRGSAEIILDSARLG
jgi:LmbE family N-acetylglucosaminyl deacetylase